MKKLLLILLIIFPVSFLSAQVEVAYRFNFLQQTYFENSEGKYNNFLKKNLQQFLLIYPEAKQYDQALWIYGDILETCQEYPAALLQYLKIIFLFPSSKIESQAHKKIEHIFTLPLDIGILQHKERIISKMNKNHHYENIHQRHFEYLSFLFSLDIKNLYPLIINEIDIHRQVYKNRHFREDLLCYWQGQLYDKLGDSSGAAAYYRIMLRLFPESPVQNRAMLRLALLNYKVLNNVEEARLQLIDLINNYSTSQIAEEAQFHLADLYDIKLENKQEALNNYKLLIESFPGSSYYCPALGKIAGIYKVTDQYEKAAQAYKNIFEKCTADSSAQAALDSLIKIYSTILNDEEQFAAAYLLFASKFNPMRRRLNIFITPQSFIAKRKKTVIRQSIFAAG